MFLQYHVFKNVYIVTNFRNRYSPLLINSIIQKDQECAGGELQVKLKIMTLTLLASLVLTACSSDSTNDGNRSKETQNIKDLVQEYSLGNIKDQTASITSSHLIVIDSDESEQTYELPKDEFFVSIAPYENETHP